MNRVQKNGLLISSLFELNLMFRNNISFTNGKQNHRDEVCMSKKIHDFWKMSQPALAWQTIA